MIDLTTQQKDMLCGFMLGDGCLYRSTPTCNAYLSFHRQDTDKEYLNWTYNSFKELCNCPPSSASYFHKTWLKTYYTCQLSMKRLPCFSQEYERWYPDGKKIIPLDFSEKDLTDWALVTWFLDDGTGYFVEKHPTILQIRLYTNGFTKSDVEKLQFFLSKRLGEYFTIGTDKEHPTQYIVIGANAAARKFFKCIDSLIPEVMIRKCIWRQPECEFYNLNFKAQISRNKAILQKEMKILQAFVDQKELTIPQIADVCLWYRNNINKYPTAAITRYLNIYEKHGLIVKTEKFIFHKGRVFAITNDGIQYVIDNFVNKNIDDLLFTYSPLAKSKHGPK